MRHENYVLQNIEHLATRDFSLDTIGIEELRDCLFFAVEDLEANHVLIVLDVRDPVTPPRRSLRLILLRE